MKRGIILFILLSLHRFLFSQELKPFVFLELFTSQGCRNCPPAEALLGKIISEAAKSGKPVYALEYHVDYWNKYGWKDPHSSFRYTMRQRNYVSVLSESQAYTPQLIVNGEKALLGSDEKPLRHAMEAALKEPALVDIALEYMGVLNDTMLVNYKASKTNRNYFLKIALVEKVISNSVSKGENAGKTLKHYNVVTIFSSFDLNEGSGTVKVPLNKKKPGPGHQLIGFVQHRQNMKILGAASTPVH